MTGDDREVDKLLDRLKRGDEQAFADFFSEHRERLWQIVHFRIDRRLAGRVDVDDILQEAYLDAVQRIPHYVANPSVSLFVWLRTIVGQTLIDVHRRHFEELSNGEVAEVLDITPATASVRYMRAIGRLKKILSNAPGFFSEEHDAD